MLTDTQVKAFKPTTNMVMVSDNTGGLTLVVQAKRTDGRAPAKTWIWRGRIGGKVKKVNIGRVDVIGASAARQRALEISNAVKLGLDPHQERRVAKATAKITATTVSEAVTLTQAWRLYMTNEGDKGRTSGEKDRLFRKDAEPVLGAKALNAITEYDLIDLFAKVAERAPVVGDRLHSHLSRFFNWSTSSRGKLKTGLTINPMRAVEKPHGIKVRRDRYLSEKELRWLLKALREARVAPRREGATRDSAERRWAVGLEVLLRTGQRKMDILDLTDDEIDFEAHTALIPAERFKSGVDHLVWLEPQVEALLKSVERPDANTEKANANKLYQRVGNDARNLAFIRKRMEKIAERPIKHWTVHDLRRTFATTMNNRVDHDERPLASIEEIARVCGRTVKGADGAYQWGAHVPVKRRLMRVWNAYLDGLL